MSDKSKIEWTDATWNPVRGCSLVSDGCTHCYAMKQAHRFSGPGKAYEGLTELGPDGPRWNGKVALVESELEKPLRWKRPRKIFVNSMSDLFHEAVPFEFIDKVLAAAALCPQHIFIVLTKRPERMAEYFAHQPRRHNVHRESLKIFNSLPDRRKPDVLWAIFPYEPRGMKLPLPNLWLGVSIEDQKTADLRIPKLLEVPAAVRFLSYEPALGPVDLKNLSVQTHGGIEHWDALDKVYAADAEPPAPDTVLDWVIAGGESGPGARPSHPDHFRKVRDQCAEADVPFFFKQWGEWAPYILGAFDWTKYPNHTFGDGPRTISVYRIGKKAAGDFLDGQQHHQFPEVG